MCRAKDAPDYRRCELPGIHRRINTLNATIARKEQELADIRAIKVKHAEVKKRLRAAEQQLAKKQDQLADQEAKLAELKPQEKKPETQERVEALTTAIATTHEEINDLNSEIRKLQTALRNAPNRLEMDKLQRRHRDLMKQLQKKREALRALEDEAAIAEEAHKRAEAEFKRAAVEDEPVAYIPSTKGDEGARMKATLTASEMKSIRSKLGQHETLGNYVLRQALTGTPNFGDKAALDYDETRFKRKGVLGRPPTVAGEKRDQTVNFREEVADRAIVRHIAASIAADYELDVNDYLRRRALGLDLLSIERDKSVQHNRERIVNLARKEEEAGVAKADNVRAFREAQYQASYNKAVQAAEKRWGASKVKTALYLNTNDFTAAAEQAAA